MPGFLLHAGANIICAHGGKAQPITLNARVLVSGQPTVTMSTTYVITGCPFPPPPAAYGPCLTAQWISGARRVFSNGDPLLLQDGKAICPQTGASLVIVLTQQRVIGI